MIKINGKEIKFSTFPNGELKLDESTIHDSIVLRSTIIVSFKFENNEDLTKLMFVRKYIDENYKTPQYIKLVVYYMPYSRMDRSENGSAFTLKYVAESINDLYFDRVIIIEPHSDVTPALIKNSRSLYISGDLLGIAMSEVKFDLEKDYIVYPDAGAQKRYFKKFDANTLVGLKHRDFETGKIENIEIIGMPKDKSSFGRKAIIVDDLCSRGGTFVMAAEQLKLLGFNEIYLVVAHCEESILFGDVFKHIKKVYTTNSIIQSKWQYAASMKIFDVEDFLK